MIRPGFLSSADRIELEACVRLQREYHGIARRANAILLLDDQLAPAVLRSWARRTALSDLSPLLRLPPRRPRRSFAASGKV